MGHRRYPTYKLILKDYSPIASYHRPTDLCLVLYVVRFKYAPCWVKMVEPYEATRPLDTVTKKRRGWFLVYPPNRKRVGLGSVLGSGSRSGSISKNVGGRENIGGGSPGSSSSRYGANEEGITTMATDRPTPAID